MFITQPQVHFPELVDNQTQCRCCAAPFVIGFGKTYEGLVRTGERELSYVRVALCSLTCVLAVAYAEQTLH